MIETCWIQHSDHKYTKIVSSLLWMFAEMGDQLQKETAGLNVFINLLNSCKNHSVLLKGLINVSTTFIFFLFWLFSFQISPCCWPLWPIFFSLRRNMTEPFATQRFRTSLAQKIGLNSDSSVNRGSKHASSNYIEYYDHMHWTVFLTPKSRKKRYDEICWKSNLDQHHRTSCNKMVKQEQHWMSKDVEVIRWIHLARSLVLNWPTPVFFMITPRPTKKWYPALVLK